MDIDKSKLASSTIASKPIKPISMIMDELKAGIEDAISKSQLPSCIVETVVFSYWLQIKSQSTAQAEADKTRYEAETQKEKEGS